MKKIYIYLFLMLVINNAVGQVAGISASKLNTVCVDVVGDKKIEFEPGFYHSSTNKYWNTNSKIENMLESLDTVSNISTMFLRLLALL